MPDSLSPNRGGRSSEDGLKSLAKVMRVLDTFSTTDRSLSLSEVCSQTGFPKSTTHRLLASMREVGLLDQDRERDRYRLGLKLFDLGNIVLANMELHREARPYVEALAKMTGQGVHLAVFDGRQAVVIHRADGHSDGAPSAFIENAAAHCTSVGKAILAHQPDAAIDRIVAAGLRAFTERTITDAAALRADLALIRSRGYAVDEGEHEPGLRCVGAPIRDQSGTVFAAISASGPGWRLPLAEVESISRIVMHSAQGISLALGWRDSRPMPAHQAPTARHLGRET